MYSIAIVCTENNSHMHEIKCEATFFSRFNAFLALSRLRSFKLSLFGMKLGTQHYLVYIIFVKWFEWKKNSHILEISCEVTFASLF